jgi:hypothetical protein
MMAGLSPFTCNTGGVAEESIEDDALDVATIANPTTGETIITENHEPSQPVS